jgi:glyoxylase-like metal-dependent hydrolase (beta-lactamase superfamily II)
VAPAHTDGDTVVQFVKADVVHMGDCFFNGNYPFIDTSSGGRVDGIVAAADRVLAGDSRQDPHHPGHGPVAHEGRPAGVPGHGEVDPRPRRQAEGGGKTKEAAVAAKPTAEFDAKWGQGFIKPDVFVGSSTTRCRSAAARLGFVDQAQQVLAVLVLLHGFAMRLTSSAEM